MFSAFISLTGQAVRALPRAIRIAPLAFGMAVGFEALQHGYEVWVGMYDSREAFIAGQAETLRLAFGATKAVAMIGAMFLIAYRLWSEGEAPSSTRTPRRYGRLLWHMQWHPMKSLPPMVPMILLGLPAIALHFALNTLAMGQSPGLTLLLLGVDSLVVGAIAVIAGVTLWLALERYSDEGSGQPSSHGMS